MFNRIPDACPQKEKKELLLFTQGILLQEVANAQVTGDNTSNGETMFNRIPDAGVHKRKML